MSATDQVKKCLLNDEDAAAMSCIQDVIASSQSDSCRPSLVLLVKEGCEGCREEKARYKADIDAGKIRLVDISTPEGLDIANRNDVAYVPAMLVLDCQNVAIE